MTITTAIISYLILGYAVALADTAVAPVTEKDVFTPTRALIVMLLWGAIAVFVFLKILWRLWVWLCFPIAIVRVVRLRTGQKEPNG